VFYYRGKNPQYKYFGKIADYLERGSNMISGGQHISDVALLYDAEYKWVNKSYVPLEDIAKELYENQIDYDIIPADYLDKITVNEFNRLQSLLNSENQLSTEENKLAATREAKIAALSKVCRDKIIDGFSVILRDGNTYYFRLTTEDQLNLLSLENQLNTGADSFVYHSTGSACKVFMREDMKKIIKTYRKYVLYHTTYFNTAKQYINSLTDINKIEIFKYGTDITGFVKDINIRRILQGGPSV
jgi:hypothetical protein